MRYAVTKGRCEKKGTYKQNTEVNTASANANPSALLDVYNGVADSLVC